MIITETEMYWLTRLDYFNGLALCVGVLFAVASIILFVASVVITFDDKEWTLRQAVCVWVLNVLLFMPLVGSMFIPTTKEMCAIKLVPMIVNDEQVQELPNKVVDLANEWIDELKPKKEEINGI